jgi:tetratricopeptide (TPR) repeat protein
MIRQPMDAEIALTHVDALIASHTGVHLNNLQSKIVVAVWHGQKYVGIADTCGYTEGHIKDISAHLWKQLSECLGEKVTKSNLKAVLGRHVNATGVIAKTADTLSCQSTAVDTRFVGREAAIAHLKSLAAHGAKLIFLQAQGGVGKTTLARRFLQQEFDSILEFAIAREAQSITSVESLVEERLQQLGEEPGREFGISLDRLKHKLKTTRVGILIDNLESALDANGKLILPHRGYVELLQTLADPSLQSLTLLTSRDRLCESAIKFDHYSLPGLDLSAWQQFLQQRQINFDQPTLRGVQGVYGGNAKAMEIISSAVSLDYGGDLAVYWKHYIIDPLAHGDLANLVVEQLDRLQQLDPDAYRFLCRLGSYRYQDIPTIPVEGLFPLLWDTPVERHRRMIESLRNRSLLEHDRGEYWLHPVLRVEAMHRLRSSSDLEPAHRAAAQFWTDCVDTIATVDDALRAFEAYYHFVEIQDYEGAADVILQRRNTRLHGMERLGRFFYKLGLLQQMLSAIHPILPKITSNYHLSGLYSILGVLYRLLGNVHRAIACHEKSGAIAMQAVSRLSVVEPRNLKVLNLKNWEHHALLNVGICQIELWELEHAKAVFDELSLHKREQLIQEQLEELYNPSVEVFSAFVHSCLALSKSAYDYADRAYQAIASRNVLDTGHRLLFLGLTYKNLGDEQKALELLQRAIAYGTEHYYPQVRANALSGLAELYRQQTQFDRAIANHLQAIEILDTIGTRCDLAEAHFQFGITYQRLQNLETGVAHFEQAIALFNAMQAPKQVQKVQLAFNAAPGFGRNNVVLHDEEKEQNRRNRDHRASRNQSPIE